MRTYRQQEKALDRSLNIFGAALVVAMVAFGAVIVMVVLGIIASALGY